ncbi:putative G-protein coupled receptor 160 isoform 2-T6 [Megaptera novaeangliae]
MSPATKSSAGFSGKGLSEKKALTQPPGACGGKGSEALSPYEAVALMPTAQRVYEALSPYEAVALMPTAQRVYEALSPYEAVALMPTAQRVYEALSPYEAVALMPTAQRVYEALSPYEAVALMPTAQRQHEFLPFTKGEDLHTTKYNQAVLAENISLKCFNSVSSQGFLPLDMAMRIASFPYMCNSLFFPRLFTHMQAQPKTILNLYIASLPYLRHGATKTLQMQIMGLYNI